MRKFFKRLTANILAVTMAVTTFVSVTPAQVFAAEDEGLAVEERTLETDISFEDMADKLAAYSLDEASEDTTPGDAEFATIGDADIDSLGATWPFKDLIQTATGAKEALALYNAGVISGFNKDASGRVNFKPNNSVTRAQFALMIYRLYVNVMHNGSKPIIIHTGMKYSDIPTSGEVYDAIKFCDYYRIISGFSATSFKPDKNISREQISLMLMNFARRLGADTTGRVSLSINTYPDCGTMQFNFKDSMGWCLKTGILSGVVKNGKQYIKGASPSSRVQCAIFLYRFVTNTTKGSVSYSKVNSYLWGTRGKTDYNVVVYAPDIFTPTAVTTFGQLKSTKYDMTISFSFSNASNFADARAKVVANERSLGETVQWRYDVTDDYVSFGYSPSKNRRYLQRIKKINGKLCSIACDYPINANSDICYDLAIDCVTSMNCVYTYHSY